MTSKVDVYSIDTIKVLSGLEPIRRRPGMYIGDVHDGSGLHYMLWDLVSNAVASGASRVRVSVEGQVAEVEDDGEGLAPAELEREVTTLRGDMGLGYALLVANALSESFEVETWRDGWSWQRRYARGEAQGGVERGGVSERTGKRVRFKLDEQIFEEQVFDRDAIRARLVELAAFHPNLRLDLMAERIEEPRGLVALLGDEELESTFVMRAGKVSIALGWAEDEESELTSYVNKAKTEGGGTHETGFWRGLKAAVGSQPVWRREHPSQKALGGRQAFKGLRAVVHVELEAPCYAGATKARLASVEVATMVEQRFAEAYGRHLAEHPEQAERVLERLKP